MPRFARLLPLPLLFLLALTGLCAGPPARAAECVRGPYIQNSVPGSVTIRWELNRPGASAVEYWTGGEPGRKVACPFLGRKHRITLSELRPGEKYSYRVWFGEERVSREHSFRAVPTDAVPFTFAVFGDFGAGTPGQFAVARLLEKSRAEFALLTGDMIYGRGEEEHYDLRFFQPYRRTLPRMNFWPALGNHDVGVKDGAAALAIFDVPANGPTGIQPGRNYSFDYGNAHIAAIDSNAPASVLQRTIGPWLERDMAASRQEWKFVFFHHPPYSSASHGENQKMKETMVPLFTRSKIDIAFAGHDHSYERTRPMGGVTYIVSGNGGNRLYPHRNPHDYTALFYNKKHGLTEVTVDGARLTLRHLSADGEEVDRHELRKGSHPAGGAGALTPTGIRPRERETARAGAPAPARGGSPRKRGGW